MENSNGYYRQPTVSGPDVVFVSEDDLWSVPLKGGVARRLTAGLGACTKPLFSPNGKLIAFSSAEEGHREVYVMPSEGGASRRLTYLGGLATVVSWQDDQHVIVLTEAFDAHRSGTFAVVSVAGGEPVSLKLGPATSMSVHPKTGAVVLERNSHRPDPAHWKRYRGGTAGKFYFASKLNGDFKPFLSDIRGNLSRPLWIGKRIYFISDHEGIGNVYSCNDKGSELIRHTSMKEYYARNLATDGKNLVFHAGAELYHLPAGSRAPKKIKVQYGSQHVQRQRKFVSAAQYLESFSLSPDGRDICLTTRGQVAVMKSWRGPVALAGSTPGVRFRLGTWFKANEEIICVSDDGGTEHLQIYNLRTRATRQLKKVSFGRATELQVAPNGSNHVAICNHRNEIVLIDLKKETSKIVARNWYGPLCDIAWSPDGRFLAYPLFTGFAESHLEIYDVKNSESHIVSDSAAGYSSPSFDPGGKYLYFVSKRELNPIYDEVRFDLGFLRTSVIGLITLQKDTPSPLLSSLEEKSKANTKKGKEENQIEPVVIDFAGIRERAVRLPIAPSSQTVLQAGKKKVFYMSQPLEGALGGNWFATEPTAKGELSSFDLETLKAEPFLSGVSAFEVSQDGSKIGIRAGNCLRIVKSDAKPEASARNEEFSDKKGWVDIERIKVMIEPMAEWRQMLHEVWRLQRDHFWREDMSKIKWAEIYKTYEALLPRISCRSEFGDLVWELQGELGTSHAYDIGGDYRSEPRYHVGFLGATFAWDKKSGGYRIESILNGNPWTPSEVSPLQGPGVAAKAGEFLMSVQGRKLTPSFTPREALLNFAGQEVEIELRRKAGGPLTRHRLSTLRAENQLRYRDWVTANTNYVHEKTKGRIGYVHVPNMGADGFAEFYRSYVHELDRDGLIIDVRFNGGGHVSELLIGKLAQKRLGMNESRWFKNQPYPSEAPAGAMVALTNEFAGSDGDIFSHAFKMAKLGPLLGTRTWGGVIGIWPRHFLVDGGVTTQPEFSFWFGDVGWGVENYGTDPDIVVDNLPHHYRQDQDPQLDLAIGQAERQLDEKPPFRPVLKDHPDLSFKR